MTLEPCLAFAVPFVQGGGSPKNTNPNKYPLNLPAQEFFRSEIKIYIMLSGEMAVQKERRVQGQTCSSVHPEQTETFLCSLSG